MLSRCLVGRMFSIADICSIFHSVKCQRTSKGDAPVSQCTVCLLACLYHFNYVAFLLSPGGNTRHTRWRRGKSGENIQGQCGHGLVLMVHVACVLLVQGDWFVVRVFGSAPL